MAAAPSSTVNAIVWEYESDIQGLFSPYDENTSNYIEEQYSKVPRNEQFCLGTPNHLLADYDIDLTSMVQCNKRSKVAITMFLCFYLKFNILLLVKLLY